MQRVVRSDEAEVCGSGLQPTLDTTHRTTTIPKRDSVWQNGNVKEVHRRWKHQNKNHCRQDGNLSFFNSRSADKRRSLNRTCVGILPGPETQQHAKIDALI
jgi:hypothetical protein